MLLYGSPPGLTLVRRDLQRRQPAGVKPAFDPDLFRARFALLQRADHLNKHDQARLETSSSTPTQGCEPVGKPSKSSTASTSPTTVMAPSKLSTGSPTSTPPANSVSSTHIVDTIINWGDEILAWHSAGRPSNGRIEGTNNLLQVLRRVAHGHTNPNNFAARALLMT